MDFGSWSSSHTILALFTVAGFIGQVAVLFYRVGQTEKRLTRSGERAEKRDAELLAMMDKWLGETNLRIDGLRSEMNEGFSDLRGEIVDVRDELRGEIQGVRTEMNQRLSDMTGEISKLNQNHINHLNRHGRGYESYRDE